MTTQALASIRSTCAPLSSFSSCSRLVHSSAPSRATTLMVAGVLPTAAEPQEITLSPIFDIFDVPSKLSEASQLIGSASKSRRPQKTVPSINPTNSLPRPPPSTLPAPIIFDGPARPRNLSLTFQRRVEQSLNSAPASSRQTRRHHTPSVPSIESEPLIEMFEGPARITRYSHRGSHRRGGMGNQIVLFGLATAVGGAALFTLDNVSISS